MKETEKESLYNKALERAKQLLNTSVAYDRFTIESIFPELKESEGERIRKMLIEFFGKGAEYNSSTNGILDKDILAWLEKQEEIKIPKWIFDFLDECRPYIGCVLGYDERRDIDGKVVAVQKWLEKQGEQKPADKVEQEYHCTGVREPKKATGVLKQLLVEQKSNCSEEALQYLRENHSSSEMSDFQAAMNIAVANAYDKGKADAINTMKTEWSEEDEKCYNSIIEHLKYSITNGKPETYKSGLLTDWLKSLKDKYTWRPSEEQM